MIEVNILKDWFMKQIVTKFSVLKINNGEGAVMSSDAIYCRTTCSKLMKLSLSCIVIRTCHCISTVINFETFKFQHNLLHDPMLSNVNFNHVDFASIMTLFMTIVLTQTKLNTLACVIPEQSVQTAILKHIHTFLQLLVHITLSKKINARLFFSDFDHSSS